MPPGICALGSTILRSSVAAPDEAFAPPVRTSVGREKASGNTGPVGSTIPPSFVAAPDGAIVPPVRTSVGREKASGNTGPVGSTFPPAAVRLR
ncbi:MAG: hypothetical protein II763_01045, partial [Bacteroidales bacterium]|nr:hypothetical protein [Bacteroidales bacterium]